jgi:hypothetical protein
LTFTSSEATTDFAIEDITLSGGGALSNFSATSSTVYTATLIPSGNGTYIVGIINGSFTDAAGNSNIEFSITQTSSTSSGGGSSHYQTFTAIENLELDFIQVKHGYPHDSEERTVYLKLYQGSGTSGELLGTSNNGNTGTASSPSSFYTYYFGGQDISLTSGQVYTWEIYYSGSQNIGWISFADNNPYDGGYGYYCCDDYTNDDFLFKIQSDDIFVWNYVPPENTTYVPDDNFEQALIDLDYDDELDDYVLTANISGVTSLDVNGKEISDLTGIEDFTALTDLHCNDNQLTTLDVSGSNTALTYLNCSGNQLTSLNVSSNTALTNLYCYDNLLTTLDVSNNTALTYLDCGSNQLTTLDVSANTALTDLYCYDNQLTSLDVSSNTALTYLVCDGNQLTSLDVSANTAIIELYCQSNQLTYLNMKNGLTDQIDEFNATNNSLTCIEVLDPSWASENWTYENGNIDEGVIFDVICGAYEPHDISIDVYSPTGLTWDGENLWVPGGWQQWILR